MNLNVREIEHKDIDSIANYWLQSDPEFLTGMGVDLKKLPTREQLTTMLTNQINATIKEKMSYALIWEIDGKPCGHSNINEIAFGETAKMHLHLWFPEKRKKGMGSELVKKSLPHYFEKFELKELLCEPYALNPAPNKTLKNIGFDFIKQYTTTPGSLNFEQEVMQWKMTKEKFKSLFH